MHEIYNTFNGWNLEIISDESDGLYKTTDTRLQGCSFIKNTRSGNGHIAEVRLEEKIHDTDVYVEAIVFKINNNGPSEEDIKFFRRKEFTGGNCKSNAANYLLKLRTHIQENYFS